jgi:hypothetical protein
LGLVRLGAAKGHNLTVWEALKPAAISSLALCKVVKEERVPDAFRTGGAPLANDALKIVGHGFKGKAVEVSPRC